MKRIVTILFLSVFISTAILSQDLYKPGFIITNELDTLYGDIKVNGPKKNAEQCVFRESGSQGTVSYYPGEIYGYRFNDGGYYVAKSLEGAESQVLKFIEYLIDGEEIDLFYYRDDNQRDRYLLAKDSSWL